MLARAGGKPSERASSRASCGDPLVAGEVEDVQVEAGRHRDAARQERADPVLAAEPQRLLEHLDRLVVPTAPGQREPRLWSDIIVASVSFAALATRTALCSAPRPRRAGPPSTRWLNTGAGRMSERDALLLGALERPAILSNGRRDLAIGAVGPGEPERRPRCQVGPSHLGTLGEASRLVRVPAQPAVSSVQLHAWARSISTSTRRSTWSGASREGGLQLALRVRPQREAGERLAASGLEVGGELSWPRRSAIVIAWASNAASSRWAAARWDRFAARTR